MYPRKTQPKLCEKHMPDRLVRYVSKVNKVAYVRSIDGSLAFQDLRNYLADMSAKVLSQHMRFKKDLLGGE